MIALAVANPHIQRDDLARFWGGRKRGGFSHSLSVKLENGKSALHELMNPTLHYLKKRIEKVDKGRVHLEDGPAFESQKLARSLRDSHEMICFITSLGHRIESQINLLMRQNRLSDAYVLDTLGSLAVESLAEQFHGRMERKSRNQGKAVTLRFSPGYCDWPIREQKKLFRLFDSAVCGVELSDSCLMQPRKSISGVFGVYTLLDDAPSPPYNPCRDCYRRDCASRRNTDYPKP